MNAFLVNYSGNTSEWMPEFNQVQEFMNELLKTRFVNGVKIQKFVNNKLTQEFTYNFNGVNWEKVS